MNCNCCNCKTVRATSIVATADGSDTLLTITVPSGTDLSNVGCLNIGVFTSIPNTATCAKIVVTNGTVTVPILQENGNNWRPCRLQCRSVLRCCILTDPAHLLIRRVAR